MNLPKITTPKYSLTIPSSGKKIEFRPFLVKEEKLLLLAQESKNTSDVSKAINEVIDSCTFGKGNLDDLTSFDVEYIFLKLRAKSVGELAEVSVKCKHCDTSNEIEINLDDVEVVKKEELPKKVMITDTIGIVPRYVSASAINANVGDDVNDMFSFYVRSVIESIFDENEVYPISQTSKEELDEFINSLNREQMSKIEEIIENAPKLEKEVTFDCVKCKKKNTYVLSGAESFF